MPDFSLRFEDPELQAAFLRNLRQRGASYRLAPTGAVECTQAEWAEVNLAAHAVRDTCFRWYFSWCEGLEASRSFLQALQSSNLPFQLEHHKEGYVFLLAREHQAAYNALFTDS